MDNGPSKSPRRNWTVEETNAFLEAYEKRKVEFEHPRKKKYAMENVLQDLLAQKVLTQYTTAKMLEVKLKNLMRAFKATMDNNKRTGESASKAPFEEKMQDIFGNRADIKNTHTLTLRGKPVTAIHQKNQTSVQELMVKCQALKEKVLETFNPETDFRVNAFRRKAGPSPSSSTSIAVSTSQPNSSTAIFSSPPQYTPKTRAKFASPSLARKAINKKEKKIMHYEERNKILAEYAKKRIELKAAAERGKEDRFCRKELFLRELFEK